MTKRGLKVSPRGQDQATGPSLSGSPDCQRCDAHLNHRGEVEGGYLRIFEFERGSWQDLLQACSCQVGDWRASAQKLGRYDYHPARLDRLNKLDLDCLSMALRDGHTLEDALIFVPEDRPHIFEAVALRLARERGEASPHPTGLAPIVYDRPKIGPRNGMELHRREMASMGRAYERWWEQFPDERPRGTGNSRLDPTNNVSETYIDESGEIGQTEDDLPF